MQLQRGCAAPQNMCLSIRAAARMDVPKLRASRAARCNYSAATPRPHYRFFSANALPRVSTTRGYAATHTRYARHTLASLAHRQMPRHLISDAHEWINEIPTVPIYYLAKPQPRERAWKNQRGKKTLLSLTLV